MNEEKGRLLKVKILRFDPKVKDSIPEVITYEVEEAPGMTLFIALNEIREKQEPSLQYDFVCRAGICGSCGMIINGRPGLACRTSTNLLPAEINLAPLPVFELIGDLSVNTGKWMRKMGERLETWIHDKEKERLLKIKILRFDPKVKNNIPEVKTYQVQEAPGMTLFIALNEIREKQEPSLQYDFVCRAGICGSCGMIINGRPGLACRTSTNLLPAEINLAPLPVFELIGDLSVNTGKWMRKMSERLETWIHDKEKEIDYSKIEEKMDPDKAEEIYELDRCVECGCCVAGCGTIRMKEDFVGAVGLNKIARFEVDPRDNRTHDDFYELIGDENGVFGCMSLMGCEDVCPKDLPLQHKIAYIRRKLVTLKNK